LDLEGKRPKEFPTLDHVIKATIFLFDVLREEHTKHLMDGFPFLNEYYEGLLESGKKFYPRP